MRRDDEGRVKDHTALNLKIQGAGAVFMKCTTIFLDRLVRQEGLDVTKVGDFHDEGQAEVHPDHVEKYSELIRESFVKASKLLKIACPMEADIKVGANWAETH